MNFFEGFSDELMKLGGIKQLRAAEVMHKALENLSKKRAARTLHPRLVEKIKLYKKAPPRYAESHRHARESLTQSNKASAADYQKRIAMNHLEDVKREMGKARFRMKILKDKYTDLMG